MTEEEMIQMTRENVALLNARDLDHYLERIDESYVGESEMFPTGLRGPEAVRRQLSMLLAAFPDLHVEIEQILASGDHVVSRLRLTGTHKGSFAGIAPTGKTVSWGGCGVSQIRNGKAIRGRVYADNASLFEQLGVFAIPKAAVAANP